jgi:hypothetical protein
MPMDRRGLILGLAAAGLAPGLAQAAEKPPVKLARAFPYLDKYFALPPAQRDRFVMGYTFRKDGKPAADLKGWIIQAGGRREPLALGPDGRVLRLPTAAELQSAMLALDVPEGVKMGVTLDLLPSVPPAREMAARDLSLAIDQANAGMAKAAGLLSFATPRLIAVSFQGAGSGTAVLADGRQAPLPLAEGAPAYAPARLTGAARLVFARIPARLTFLDKV